MNPCIGALDVIVVVFVVVTYLHCRCHPLLEPSGAFKLKQPLADIHPTQSNPSTYSFECSISFNYDKKK